MTQILNLLETETLNTDDQAILHQSGVDKRISLELAGILSWATKNGYNYTGKYTDNPTITGENDFVTSSGLVYFGTDGLGYPHAINSTTYPDPISNPNLVKHEDYDNRNDNIGTGAKNYAAGDHSHSQYLEDGDITQADGNFDLNGHYLYDSTDYNVTIVSNHTSLLPSADSTNSSLILKCPDRYANPSGVGGIYLKDYNVDESEFFINKSNDSTKVQIGTSPSTDNSIDIKMPVVASNGFTNKTNIFSSGIVAYTLNSPASTTTVFPTTSAVTITLSSNLIDDRYIGNTQEILCPKVPDNAITIINNTGLPLRLVYANSKNPRPIPNGGSFQARNCSKFTLLTTTGDYNTFLSY